MSSEEGYNASIPLNDGEENSIDSKSETLVPVEAVKNSSTEKWKNKKAALAKKKEKVKAKAPAVWSINTCSMASDNIELLLLTKLNNAR